MEVSAIIIAGGQSRRMGEDKALLRLGGVTILEKMIQELEPVASRIVIAAGNKKEVYRSLFDKQVVTDVYADAGPLAGLHAGLSASTADWNIAVACDTPFANRGLFQALLSFVPVSEIGDCRRGEPEAVVASVAGRVHPLLAVYRRSVLPSLDQELREGNHKMMNWLNGLQVVYVDGQTLAAGTGISEEQLAFNMNHPEDYAQAKIWYEKKGHDFS
ncbi:molybdenum cofactor guanylyltransferase [Paenibacillus puldeungensis]|uniref:Probable molybdenum cofactor guanylyltransferase n=1 Tax=Paenibacillus puldeungensis TaxID=696536 RepID=A0ABW3S4V8_9BACL